MSRVLTRRTGRARDRGATAVEYALLLTAIAAVIIAIIAVLGSTVTGLFTITW